MLRVLVQRLVTLALPLALVGCGFFGGGEERPAWRGQAEAACYARHEVQLSPYIQRVREIQGKGICGMEQPLWVAGLNGGQVSMSPRATLDCPMTSALDRWVADTVQPAAYRFFGSPLVALKNAASYGCRTIDHIQGAKLSEHAFGNAFDVGGFVFANGYTLTIKAAGAGTPAEQAFLREIQRGACGPFKTVLGPGSDRFHTDNLHLDLAWHNARRSAYCRPVIRDEGPMSVPGSPLQEDVPMASLPQQPGAGYALPQGSAALRAATPYPGAASYPSAGSYPAPASYPAGSSASGLLTSRGSTFDSPLLPPIGGNGAGTTSQSGYPPGSPASSGSID